MADKIDVMNINKFDGRNYRQWKFQITCALRAKGLQDIVNGDEEKPDVKTNIQEHKKWIKDDANAMFTLTSAMALDQITLVENCKSSSEIIIKLDSIYEQKTEMNKMLVHERFHQYKMISSDTISQHIAKVENLAQQIKETGEEVSDVAIITKILGSLPQKYRNLRQAWISMDEAKQTIANLRARLLDEEASLMSYEESDSALLVTKAGYNNSSIQRNPIERNNNRPRVTCYNCQKKGHFASQCRAPKKNRGEKKYNHSKENEHSQSNVTAFSIVEDSLLLTSTIDDDYWIMDSGASAHMTHKREYFSIFETMDDHASVKLGNNQGLVVKGKGTVKIQKLIGENWHESTITNVLYVPDLKKNLFSEGVITAKGMKIIKEDNHAEVYENSNIVACAIRESNNIYRLLFRTITVSEANATTSVDIKLWHERLGHINKQALKQMLTKGDIKNVSIDNINKFFCEACVYGKGHKLPFKTVVNRKTKPGEFIHSDICGPMSQPSVSGMRYFILFKDDNSGYRVVYFIKHKSDAFDSFKDFVNHSRNKFGSPPKVLHVDNGTEYCNNIFKEYLSKNGISLETTAPYTPEQNGRAERDMRTIVESARSMIYAKDVPINLWSEAINTAVYILNRTPTTQAPDSTPYQLWTGKKPILDHTKIFGCEAYMHIPKELRTKLDPKCKKLMFVGYDGNSTNYRLYDEESKKIKVSRNVIFNENAAVRFPRRNTVEIQIIEDNTDVGCTQSNEHENQTETLESENNRTERIQDIEDDLEKQEATTQQSINSQVNADYKLRNRDKIRMPARYDYEANFAETDIPETYEEAISSVEAKNWTKSIQEELDALEKNNTWEVVKLPPGRSTIGSKWVFKVKRNSNGDIVRYKSRLCAKGYAQKQGIDYNETFAPTTRFDSIRILLSVAARNNYEIMQFDIKTAFLYGNLQEDIYLTPPDGTDISSNMVCKLKKSLYGLKQASHCWNTTFHSFLSKYGFVQSNADNCVYRGQFNNVKVLLILYVDDGLVMAETKEALKIVLHHLQATFEVRINEPDNFVGLKIERNREKRSIFIHQIDYINQIIKRFNLETANSISIPADPQIHLNSTGNSQESKEKSFPYREAVGCLIFAAIVSRPDISFAVGVVSRFLSNHTDAHWNAVKRIIKYLIGTNNRGIEYKHSIDTEQLVGYSDSDYANDIDTRRSTSGYVFMLNGGPITWNSQRQHSVALSTTEAEYMAGCAAVKEVTWLRQLLRDIGEVVNGPSTLFIDNQSAIRLIHNPEFHKRTKHIDIRYHFIREKLKQGDIYVQYKCTKDQLADIFTKPLPSDRFKTLRDSISTIKI